MRITAAFDPVTRIEGHLNIEITIDTVNGLQQVVDAKAVGGLFRGFEKLLIGRDPRDAQHITERICGVCPVAHGLAAVRALDDAFGVSVPANGRILRNLTNGSNFVESHILHFYLLSLPDYIAGPATAPWQAGWDVDRRLNSEDNDRLMQHYLQALTMRRKADQMTAVFGGRMPHPPAFIPGGFTANPRAERIATFTAILDEVIAFIENTYLPDVQFLAGVYDDYQSWGRGPGNLLAYGAFELNDDQTSKLFAPGIAWNAADVIDALDTNAINEHVLHSWFLNHSPANPTESKTEPQHPKDGAYSWLKAPRYLEEPCEVGPLARMWVNGDYRQGVSIMDRHLARAHEALKIARAIRQWVAELTPEGSVCNTFVPAETAEAAGLTEAPRGALGHWVRIEQSRIAHYQVISPTTWNVSPRDDAGVPGPLEQALLGTPIENAEQPIEIMRIIHSFDPCLDCATHVIRPGRQVKIYPVL